MDNQEFLDNLNLLKIKKQDNKELLNKIWQKTKDMPQQKAIFDFSFFYSTFNTMKKPVLAQCLFFLIIFISGFLFASSFNTNTDNNNIQFISQLFWGYI